MARTRTTLTAALTTILLSAAAPTTPSLTALLPAPAAAANSSCPDASLMPRPGNLDRVRAATECLVNQIRERHGENPLRQNPRIQDAAQRHSQDMAFGDYFEHVGPRGDTPLDRLRASGYVYSRRIGFQVGENIAWGTLSLATPEAIVQAWVHSPEHLANILNARYRDTAIGVSPHPLASQANGQPGAIYTQDFGVLITGNAARSGSPAPAGARATHRSHKLPASRRGWRRRSKTAEPGPSSSFKKRRSKGHGSTRRQVRHRHRLGKRHRARHRRAARRAGRKRAHQRSRRRHRAAGRK